MSVHLFPAMNLYALQYSGRRLYMQLWYGTFYMHRYKQSRGQNSVFDTVSLLNTFLYPKYYLPWRM